VPEAAFDICYCLISEHPVACENPTGTCQVNFSLSSKKLIMKVKSPISDKFTEFLNELLSTTHKPYKDITYQLFYDLFKIRSSQWKYKVLSKREVDFSLSDIFQDLLAHYFRILLPNEYVVYCEHKKGKVRPDILIKKNDKNWAVIEVKTTIGWDRALIKNDKYLKRLRILSQTFNVPINRTFYIFEAARNVNSHFYKIFKNKKRDKICKYIYPLFLNNAHPFFLSNERDRKNNYEEFDDSEIFKFYKENVATTLDYIIEKKIKVTT